MARKRFIDIEISADIGQVRLYVDDENYENYHSEELLELINGYYDAINEFRILTDSLKTENKKLKGRLTDLGVEYY